MPQSDSNYTTRTLPRLAICKSIPVSRLLSAGGVWEHARYSTVLMHFHELVTLCHLLCFCVSVLPKPALCCLLVQLRTNLTPVFAATAAPVSVVLPGLWGLPIGLFACGVIVVVLFSLIQLLHTSLL